MKNMLIFSCCILCITGGYAQDGSVSEGWQGKTIQLKHNEQVTYAIPNTDFGFVFVCTTGHLDISRKSLYVLISINADGTAQAVHENKGPKGGYYLLAQNGQMKSITVDPQVSDIAQKASRRSRSGKFLFTQSQLKDMAKQGLIVTQ